MCTPSSEELEKVSKSGYHVFQFKKHALHSYLFLTTRESYVSISRSILVSGINPLIFPLHFFT